MIVSRIILATSFLFSYSAQSSVPLKQRTELFSFFEKKICGSPDVINKLDHHTFWQEGVFDSQIAVSTFFPEKRGALSRENIHMAAKIQMAKEKHRGVLYGKCAHKYAWVASFPSPTGLTSKELIPSLEQNCSSFETHTIPETKASSITDLLKNKKNYAFASVICNPRRPSWLGPQEWFLIQGGKQDPLLEQMGALKQPKQIDILSVFTTIAKMRRLADSSQVTINRSLDQMAQRLARSGSILHNSKRLKALSLLAQEKIPELSKTAETRVIVKDIKEFIELTLSSPTHRKMLLNRQASHVGIEVKKLQNKFLIVVISAELKDLKTSSIRSKERKR